MKRTILMVILFAGMAAGAFAQQFIITGQWSMQGNDDSIISSAKDGQVMNLGGLGMELVLRHIGFGSTLLVNFHDSGTEQWTTNWDLRAYMSYHFFRDSAFLDPFVQAGGGAYGNVTLAGDACYGDLEMVDGVNLAFYPYLAAGLGLRFRGGLYASGQYNWRPVSGAVPCCDMIGTPELREFELVLSVGFAFGGRR